MDPGRKATWAAGCEQPASPPPDHSQRLDDSEVRVDTRQQEIIYMELSRQSHTASRARAIYPPSSARLQRTPRRRRSASVQRRVASPPLPTSPHLSWRGTTHRRSGRQSDMAGRARAIYLGRPPASRPRNDGERREGSDVHMGTDRNRMTGSGEEGAGP